MHAQFVPQRRIRCENRSAGARRPAGTPTVPTWGGFLQPETKQLRWKHSGHAFSAVLGDSKGPWRGQPRHLFQVRLVLRPPRRLYYSGSGAGAPDLVLPRPAVFSDASRSVSPSPRLGLRTSHGRRFGAGGKHCPGLAARRSREGLQLRVPVRALPGVTRRPQRRPRASRCVEARVPSAVFGSATGAGAGAGAGGEGTDAAAAGAVRCAVSSARLASARRPSRRLLRTGSRLPVSETAPLLHRWCTFPAARLPPGPWDGTQPSVCGSGRARARRSPAAAPLPEASA